MMLLGFGTALPYQPDIMLSLPILQSKLDCITEWKDKNDYIKTYESGQRALRAYKCSLQLQRYPSEEAERRRENMEYEQDNLNVDSGFAGHTYGPTGFSSPYACSTLVRPAIACWYGIGARMYSSGVAISVL